VKSCRRIAAEIGPRRREIFPRRTHRHIRPLKAPNLTLYMFPPLLHQLSSCSSVTKTPERHIPSRSAPNKEPTSITGNPRERRDCV